MLVVAERADRIPSVAANSDPSVDPPFEPTDPTATDPSEPVPADNSTVEPVEPVEDPQAPPADPVVDDPNAINFGDAKPEQAYDDFLLASFVDIEAWLQAEFEPAFGQPFTPLEGDVFAGYEERTDDIPGCGEPVTSYQDLRDFAAFYCPIGDFIVYDDGDEGLLARLADEYGPATIGIVLAHEYGHALQSRIGALDGSVPTVTTEQQADCIAGAWAGRATNDAAAGVTFTDNDLRAAMIALITVQDPVGADPTGTGAHGSGFDRVGAFQVGFQEGLGRCALLIDEPLPLTPVRFTSDRDVLNEGNAPFGFEPDQLFGFLVPDLNLLYDNDLQDRFPDFVPLDLVAVQSADEIECDTPFGLFTLGVDLCSATNTVYLNEPAAIDRFNEFGDFAPGYLLGIVWAEHALVTDRSELRGEERQLRNDCLVGAWVNTVTPDPNTFTLPEPRDDERTASISPNDLTEAIQMAILIGDPTSTSDVLGTPFEKIDAFRRGALGGFESCG